MSTNPKAERMIDQNGVRDFANAMRKKLTKKRKEGRGGWWNVNEVTTAQLRTMLINHIEKGDMVDIGNFAMMVWNREQKGLP